MQPGAVAGKISKALTARRPGTRYKVTPSARVMIGTRRMVTDRMWDRLVRSQGADDQNVGGKGDRRGEHERDAARVLGAGGGGRGHDGGAAFLLRKSGT